MWTSADALLKGGMAEEEWEFVDGLKRTMTAWICINRQNFAFDRSALSLATDLWAPAAPGASRRAPHQEVQALDGEKGGGGWLVP